MIEQGFNYADSSIKQITDFFETRVENLRSGVDKIDILHPPEKFKEKKSKKKKHDDLNSSVVESREKSSVVLQQPQSLKIQ